MAYLFPFSDAISNGSDGGGHTQRLRDLLGIAGTGDVSRRIAVRIRNNDQVRQTLLYRHSESGDREGTSYLATCHRIAGSFSGGIRLAEEAYKAWYVRGRVFPISDDDNIHLRIHLPNNEFFIGEGKLDQYMVTANNKYIEGISYTQKLKRGYSKKHIQPTPYQPAIKSLATADVRIITSSSWWGSTLATTEVGGVYQALGESESPVVMITNAVDVEGRTADYYLAYFAEKMGRKVDLALINDPDSGLILPPSYAREHHYFVQPNRLECLKYADEVIQRPFAEIVELGGDPTIRHIGPYTAAHVAQYLVDRKILSPRGLDGLLALAA